MPSRKKNAPEVIAGRRRSGRLSASEHKSSYFEGSDDQGPATKKQRRTVSKAKEESGDDDQYQDDSSDGVNGGEEEADDGTDDDDDDAPRKVEIIPLEKMRDTGGVEYAGYKIHRNSLLFLKDLKSHNKRTWLKSHDGEYRRALKDWESFVEAATQTIINVDETVPELPVKDVIFRIYRDVRFSKIKTPYKPYFSAAWSRTGRKGPYACYYVHCEPGSAFIGGGLWHPEAAFVAKLRRSIDRHPERWRRILTEPLLKNVFFPQLKSNAGPDAAVKAFASKNQDNALKKRPMGYEITHRDIELLKLRNYTISTRIDADLLARDDVQEKLEEIVRALFGFVTFLNSIIMPDPGVDGDDDSDSDEEEQEADEDSD